MSRGALVAGALVALALPAAAPAQAVFKDSLVQAPQLSPPQRGSLAGQYARVAFGPADVSRGGFALDSPYDAPEERGAPGASPFPVYSPDTGISEWGMGWQASLAITRSRPTGELDYATDDLSGPWGQLSRGTDGNYYPLGMKTLVRVQPSGSALVAYLPDGAQWTFGASARVDTARGPYAWYLEDVVSATGRRTHFTYDGNSSGRLFLRSVTYGGTGATPQASLDFTYELLPVPFTDYQPGFALRLDRRVSRVTASSRHLVTGVFAERWHFTPAYQGDGVSPAFWLASVTRTYASGASAPPATFTYGASADRLSAASFRLNPKLDAAVSQFGFDLFQANRGSLADADLDARTDFEHNTRATFLQQRDADFDLQELPPAPPDVFAPCRPAFASASNPPRTLVQARAADDVTSVVALRSVSFGSQTAFDVCNRIGQKQYEQLLPGGGWVLGPNTRLADLNRDRQPDLIRVFAGGYQISPNTSTAAAYGFGPPVSGTLDRAFTPGATWVHDFNGDGVPDLILRGDTALYVWYGKGGLAFDAPSAVFQLYSSGVVVSNLSAYELTFVDANKDGLTDVLVASSSRSTALYLNTGTRLQRVDVPGLAFIDGLASRPVVADLAGTGDMEVAVVRSGHAYSLALDGPGVGLLASADDGAGTTLRFGYARSPAVAGTRHRQAVLGSLTAEVSGRQRVTSSYSYQGPRLHSLGKFLLGFDSVTRQGPTVSESMSFLNADAFAGIRTSARTHDANVPAVDSVQGWTYEDAVFSGIPWKRPRSFTSSWQSPDGSQSLTERTDTLAYDAEVCPSLVQKDSGSGAVLTTLTERASISALANSLHCLPRRIVLTGTHADSSLDFRHEALIARDGLGQTTEVDGLDHTGAAVVLQQVAYNPDGTIAAVTTPGRGTTQLSWLAGAQLLDRVVAPDLSAQQVTDRDPVTSATRTLREDRGGMAYDATYRFDGQERLSSRWDSLGASGPGAPLETLEYRFATAAGPGSLHARTLVDAQSGAVRESVELVSGAGEALASLALQPGGWAAGPLSQLLPATAERARLLRAPLPLSVDAAAVDYATLFAGAQEISRTRGSAFGHEPMAQGSFHAGVSRQVLRALAVSGGRLVETAVENGALTTTTAYDAARRATAITDEEQATTAAVYDALGRLRQVTLADRSRHRVDFDDYGRRSLVRRDGVAAVSNQYGPSGLLAAKVFSSPSGAPVRRVDLQRDAIGRVSAQVHTDLTTGATQRFDLFYDGATPAGAPPGAALGLLTGVRGSGFSKTMWYRADGALLRRATQLDGWRTVQTDLRYFEDGSVRGRTTAVLDAAGATLSTSDQGTRVDGLGRAAELDLDGALLATLAYDAEGHVASASFAGGDRIDLTYDGLTRALTGMAQSGRASASSAFRLNERGLPAQESYSISGLRFDRTLGYSARGMLTRSDDAASSYAYAYDVVGLPAAPPPSLALDALGRTTGRGDLHLTYGPAGDVATATRGAQSWSFITDERGRRLARRRGDQLEIGYLEEGYLDASGLTQPVELAGVAAGVVQAGAFRPVPLDLRGTVIGDADGSARLPSPYGARAVVPSGAAALDYVKQGYDADLGLVRMGVRDYDPALGRFLVPDPLFLEQPDRCLESPLECNLYGYARGNPLLFDDPEGLSSDELADRLGVSQIIYRYSFSDSEIGWAAIQYKASLGHVPQPNYRPLAASAISIGPVTPPLGDAVVQEAARTMSERYRANPDVFSLLLNFIDALTLIAPDRPLGGAHPEPAFREGVSGYHSPPVPGGPVIGKLRDTGAFIGRDGFEVFTWKPGITPHQNAERNVEWLLQHAAAGDPFIPVSPMTSENLQSKCYLQDYQSTLAQEVEVLQSLGYVWSGSGAMLVKPPVAGLEVKQ
jgi:RHS repeat-associated protein